METDQVNVPFDFLRQYLGGEPFLVAATLVLNGLSFTTLDCLVDTGAGGSVFINLKLARKLQKTLRPERITNFTPQLIGGYDDKSTTQLIDVALRMDLQVQGRRLGGTFLVVDMKHDLILGRKWLEQHDVIPDVRRHRLLYPLDRPLDPPEDTVPLNDEDRNRQLLESLAYRPKRTTTPSATGDEPGPVPEEEPAQPPSAEEVDQQRRNEMEVRRRIDELEQEICRLRQEPARAKTGVQLSVPMDDPPTDPLLRKMENQLRDEPHPPIPTPPPAAGDGPQIRFDDIGPYLLKKDWCGWYKDRPVEVATVGAVPFLKHVKEGELIVTSLNEIDEVIANKRVQESKPPVIMDDEEFRAKAEAAVPSCYHDILDVFSKTESDTLSPHRPGVDLHIELKDGAGPEQLSFAPLYKMSLEELEVARAYITENLEKGFIVPSSAPWAAPVLMAAKPGGGLRFCVDYRKLNALTRKDQYPLPLIEETFSRIRGAKVFTKLDIRQAFHKVRFQTEQDEELTTFRTRYGSYKYKVVPFGLTNGPATFQRFINHVLRGYVDVFCSAYIDDILIWSDDPEEHERHVRMVLERLREAGLQADIKKCEFHVTETKYLGFIIGKDGITVDPVKIDAIRRWEEPSNVTEVQSFLGLCNFYRRFVPAYSRVVKPMTNLTRKGLLWHWGDEERAAFEELKQRLMSAPVLAHFYHDRPTKVETDASDGVVAGVLSQLQDDGFWHPVSYFSESMSGPALNYGIHDKELMAVVKSLRFWRAELVGLQAPEFEVITDHRALEFFSTKRLLTSRQAGWAEELSAYNFYLTYRPGTENIVADALSRPSEDRKTLKERQAEERTMAIFRRDNDRSVHVLEMVPSLCVLDGREDPPPLSGVALTERLLQANLEDPALEAYRQRAKDDAKSPWSMLHDKYVLYQGRLVVSTNEFLRTRVIEDLHCRAVTGHPGKTKTRKLVTTSYWWPGMGKDIDDFVANCHCKSAKDPRDKTPGLLKPIAAPNRPWKHIVIDFKEAPKCKDHGHDNALVIVDKLSKESWTIPCTKSATARDAALLFWAGPFRDHGLPETVGSDRGPQFVAHFANEMSRILGIDWRLSSSGHSQSAGQAEVFNEYFDQRLRPFVNHFQDNWCYGCPAVDAAQRVCPHESLDGLSPFEVTHGFRMPLHYDWENRTSSFAGMAAKEKLSRKEAQDVASNLREFFDFARRAIGRAQDRMVKQANKHRREPDFDVGDYVFVIKKSWSTDRPSDKLDFPMTRSSYKILARKGHSFEVDLPASWRMRRVFPPDRLRLDPRNPLPGQGYERPEAEVVHDDDEWEVDHIVASRVYHGVLQYQVQWRGWDPDPEFYDANGFKNAPAKLRAFHDDYPEAEGPPRRLAAWEAACLNDDEDEPHADDNLPVEVKGSRKVRTSGRKRT